MNKTHRETNRTRDMTPFLISMAVLRCMTHLGTAEAMVCNVLLNRLPQQISFKGLVPKDITSPPGHSPDKSSPLSCKLHTCQKTHTHTCAPGHVQLTWLCVLRYGMGSTRSLKHHTITRSSTVLPAPTGLPHPFLLPGEGEGRAAEEGVWGGACWVGCFRPF